MRSRLPFVSSTATRPQWRARSRALPFHLWERLLLTALQRADDCEPYWRFTHFFTFFVPHCFVHTPCITFASTSSALAHESAAVRLAELPRHLLPSRLAQWSFRRRFRARLPLPCVPGAAISRAQAPKCCFQCPGVCVNGRKSSGWGQHSSDIPGPVAKPRLSSYELSYATRKLDPPSPRQRPAARDMSAWLGLPDVSGQDVAACADALASARRAVRFHRHQPLDAFRPAQVQDLRLLEVRPSRAKR